MWYPWVGGGGGPGHHSYSATVKIDKDFARLELALRGPYTEKDISQKSGPLKGGLKIIKG